MCSSDLEEFVRERKGLFALFGHFLQRLLAGKIDAALFIDLDDLAPGLVANIQNILHLFHKAVFQLIDADQAFLAGSDLHEGAEVHDAGDLAIEQIAHLGILGDGFDHLAGLFAIGGVDCRDADGAVVLDVDLGVGLGGDLLDDCAALADDLADLVGIDGDLDRKSVGRERVC